jgi:hypothetical protein
MTSSSRPAAAIGTARAPVKGRLLVAAATVVPTLLVWPEAAPEEGVSVVAEAADEEVGLASDDVVASELEVASELVVASELEVASDEEVHSEEGLDSEVEVASEVVVEQLVGGAQVRSTAALRRWVVARSAGPPPARVVGPLFATSALVPGTSSVAARPTSAGVTTRARRGILVIGTSPSLTCAPLPARRAGAGSPAPRVGRTD